MSRPFNSAPLCPNYIPRNLKRLQMKNAHMIFISFVSYYVINVFMHIVNGIGSNLVKVCVAISLEISWTFSHLKWKDPQYESDNNTSDIDFNNTNV